jgi:hypothetical protein
LRRSFADFKLGKFGEARYPQRARRLRRFVACAGCAETPQQEADWQAPKIHRTGSNIPVKDCGAEKIEVASPDITNPSNRPMANVLTKKPGQ